MIYGYLRVSTDKQDLNNQKHALLEYANAHGMGKVEFIKDKISTRKKLAERKVFDLVNLQAKRGDVVLCSEVSRLGRNTLEVLELAGIALRRSVKLVITKQAITFDASIQSKIYLTVLGLVAEIERDFIQQRTVTALQARKALITDQGYFITKLGKKRTHLGNAAGSKYNLKLEKHRERIDKYIAMGVSKASICKMFGTTYPTLQLLLSRKPTAPAPAPVAQGNAEQ